MYYWYTDTLLHWRLLFHIVVSSLCEYSVHSYFMFLYHCYIDSPVYMHWLSLYSCCMDHFLYYMNYCYMDIPVFPLHDCFSLLILISRLLDMWNIDMRCVKLSATWIQQWGHLLNSTSLASRCPLSYFMLVTELMSCYRVTCIMHCTCSDTLCSLNII